MRFVLYCSLQQSVGESLEEQLGQRLLRMPPPAQVPARMRTGGAPMEPAVFRLPEEATPTLTADSLQVWHNAAVVLAWYYVVLPLLCGNDCQAAAVASQHVVSLCSNGIGCICFKAFGMAEGSHFHCTKQRMVYASTGGFAR